MSKRRSSERAVVLLSYLSPAGRVNFYSLVELLGRLTSWIILRWRYKHYQLLAGKECTHAAFVQSIESLIRDESIQQIDLIIMIHGKPGKLIFYNEDKKDGKDFKATAEMSKLINKLEPQNKLGLVYSTACYGESHNRDFLSAGFKSSIGAIAVNTNAMTEFPIFLLCWILGMTVEQGMKLAQPFYKVFDAIAKLVRYKDTNSAKVLDGRATLRISN